MIHALSRCLALASMLFLISFAVTVPSAGAQSLQEYEFDEPAQEALFHDLIDELRCPKCQNQSIADSNAELAKDLRDRTYVMVKQGASKQEVIDYMVARYGDFVHYQPPMTFVTSILWWGPLTVLAVGALVILYRVRRQKVEEIELDAGEQARLEELRREGEKEQNR
ncbi:cytochrome c-type biogenesis protein [Pseudidiomarina insulisalsae]|uniref:Cytochrome c-type biogenesis protein n=1 Tax=Pseudidiomarina insulisalsae TaxID=575789 RepID=A0A432YLN1_9GAMM|nr:cytochrome c-type biogenesis protein [Pseudidiomarina insulisalsae]RUO61850.1 cystathionine gamma-synthase [Pseudidiomarina insulisalsae]